MRTSSLHLLPVLFTLFNCCQEADGKLGSVNSNRNDDGYIIIDETERYGDGISNLDEHDDTQAVEERTTTETLMERKQEEQRSSTVETTTLSSLIQEELTIMSSQQNEGKQSATAGEGPRHDEQILLSKKASTGVNFPHSLKPEFFQAPSKNKLTDQMASLHFPSSEDFTASANGVTDSRDPSSSTRSRDLQNLSSLQQFFQSFPTELQNIINGNALNGLQSGLTSILTAISSGIDPTVIPKALENITALITQLQEEIEETIQLVANNTSAGSFALGAGLGAVGGAAAGAVAGAAGGFLGGVAVGNIFQSDSKEKGGVNIGLLGVSNNEGGDVNARAVGVSGNKGTGGERNKGSVSAIAGRRVGRNHVSAQRTSKNVGKRRNLVKGRRRVSYKGRGLKRKTKEQKLM